jgi:hypothetical protein
VIVAAHDDWDTGRSRDLHRRFFSEPSGTGTGRVNGQQLFLRDAGYLAQLTIPLVVGDAVEHCAAGK